MHDTRLQVQGQAGSVRLPLLPRLGHAGTLTAMRNHTSPRRWLLSPLPVLALLSACSGGQKGGAHVIPEPLRDHCIDVNDAFAKAQSDGSHEAVTLEVQGGGTLTEAQVAQKLLDARTGGETWVIARAGTGKSHLGWALEAQACKQRAVIRVDAAQDVRPEMLTATAKRPALAVVLLNHLGVKVGEDPGEQLRDALDGQPWILILDGTDELVASEHKRLDKEVAWLQQLGTELHTVRLERPGMVDEHTTPDLALTLPELTTAQVDALLQKRFPQDGRRQKALAWLAQYHLDRKRTAAGPYVHMTTRRDVETVADLAADALDNPPDPALPNDMPRDPVRADIYALWTTHRLGAVVQTMTAAMGWLDRIVAQGVIGRDPDLTLTIARCQAVQAPGSTTSEEACRKLTDSGAVKRGKEAATWVLANRTLVDLALARWHVARETDCALLTSAVADMGSLEIMGLVASTVEGRRCLAPIIASVCSRGLPASTVAGFVDEALPFANRDTAFFALARAPAKGPCEQGVWTQLERQAQETNAAKPAK